MTIQAQYWVHEPARPPAERVVHLETDQQVREFVALLAGEHVSDALLTHTRRPRIETAIPDDDAPGSFLTVPDHSVIVGIRGQRGALSYKGNDGHTPEPVHLCSHGQGPNHPVLYETEELPANCEIPAETVADALVEFLATARRPTNLAWQHLSD